MEKSKKMTIIIKTSISIVFAMLFVILFAQYITIAGLNAKRDSLNKELSISQTEYQQKTDEYNEINDNYDEFVEDYMRENYEYIEDGEILGNI